MSSYVESTAANCSGCWVVRISQGISSQEGGEVQVQSLVISLAKGRLHLELGTCDICGPSYIDSSGDSLKHELDVIWSCESQVSGWKQPERRFILAYQNSHSAQQIEQQADHPGSIHPPQSD